MKEKKMELAIVNPKAAGIDVGSRSHVVAVGQGKEHVREFGVYASDLKALVDWLEESEVETVALESTGDYWQNLFMELVERGLDVYLVNGKYTKNVNQKKTDVQDCQYIQKMHSLGFLVRCFLPDSMTDQLRTYCRLRTKLISKKANTAKSMQKYLRLLNYRLDVVVSDVTGQTGLEIIEAITGGELDGTELSKLRHFNCRKSEEEISRALEGNGRVDYLYGLTSEYRRYQFFEREIQLCDEAIGKLIENQMEQLGRDQNLMPEKKPYKRLNKNSLKTVDLNVVSYQYFEGIDLLKIPGVSYSTILSIMSELGPKGIERFPTSKHFVSWLRLAPNNKISGGRTISSKVPRGSNRLKIAFRNAAYSISRIKDCPLKSFYIKIAFKKGSTKAITATARKLAVIIWNMLYNQVQYESREEYLFLDQRRKLIARMRRQINKYQITWKEVGELSDQELIKAFNLGLKN